MVARHVNPQQWRQWCPQTASSIRSGTGPADEATTHAMATRPDGQVPVGRATIAVARLLTNPQLTQSCGCRKVSRLEAVTAQSTTSRCRLRRPFWSSTKRPPRAESGGSTAASASCLRPFIPKHGADIKHFEH